MCVLIVFSTIGLIALSTIIYIAWDEITNKPVGGSCL